MKWTVQSPYMEITSQCNLYCKHCYNSSSSKNTVRLSKEEILNCLDYFSNMGVRELAISGGEPLLHPDIVDILCDAKNKGIQVLLATNGTLLSDKIVRQVRPYVKYYQISIDGNKEAHEAIRGINSYEAAFRGIYQLCKEGLQKQTRLRMTISQANFNSITSLIEEAARLGLEAVHFSVIRNQGRASEVFKENLQLSDEQLIELYYQVHKLRHQYRESIEISPLTVDGGECALIKDDAVLRPRIDVYGNVYPCEGYLDSEKRLGNLDEGLSIVFSDDRVQHYLARLKQSRRQVVECSTCYWDKFICIRGCPAEAYRLGNDLGTDGLCNVRKIIWKERLHSLNNPTY